ncbi:MAG: hypothetical protein HY560_03075 [Gemmatimonadetes bacterium]|nr:hypothetical protein [Gemmatimonadota bacterium]
MKRLALLLGVLSGMITWAHGAVAQEAPKRAKPRFYLQAATSGRNAYKIGNLKTFLENRAGRPVTLGTAWALMGGSLGLQFPGTQNRVGLEVQFTATQPDAIATFSVFGGYNVFLKASFLNVAMPISLGFDPRGRLALVLEPGLDIGIMGGTMSFSGDPNTYTQSAAAGVGGHGAAGIDVMLGDHFGFVTRIGYRYLQIPETHRNSGSSTGYSSFYVSGSSGETVKVDWSGSYMMAGLRLAF